MGEKEIKYIKMWFQFSFLQLGLCSEKNIDSQIWDRNPQGYILSITILTELELN